MKYCLSNMMALDIYLSGTKTNPLQEVENTNLVLPLLSWDIFSQVQQNNLSEAKRSQDLIKVMSLAKKLKWESHFTTLFEKEQFEAIVVTNLKQKIVWVNNGFSKMTGYPKVEALNKTPHFLQGENTSSTVKERIRKQLKGYLPFTEVITNYKKNGEHYKCEVKIYPLYNKQKKKTHYIAFEKQVV